jgi:hypothetical protein
MNPLIYSTLGLLASNEMICCASFVNVPFTRSYSNILPSTRGVIFHLFAGNNSNEPQGDRKEQLDTRSISSQFDISSNAPKKKNRKKRNQKNNPKHIKAKSIAKGRDPLISLNMNLDYLAKTGAPRRAEELLLRIENLYEEG